jgi:hypothetical protein
MVGVQWGISSLDLGMQGVQESCEREQAVPQQQPTTHMFSLFSNQHQMRRNRLLPPMNVSHSQERHTRWKPSWNKSDIEDTTDASKPIEVVTIEMVNWSKAKLGFSRYKNVTFNTILASQPGYVVALVVLDLLKEEMY